MRFALRACLVAALLGVAGNAAAQREPASAGIARPEVPVTGGRAGSRGGVGLVEPILSADSAWWVPLSSTLLPGLGQVRLRQNRFMAYLALEAYALTGWVRGEAAVQREATRYRGLARDIARAFVPGNSVEGDWAYYESMSHYLESGVYDRNLGGGVLQPESDLTTYNGQLWLRARELSNWEDPNVEPNHSSVEYRSAIEYYNARSVKRGFEWSWRNAQLEWHEYQASIRRKNDASRDARHYLALVAVNHLLSTVDAYITVRLRGGLGAPRGEYRLTGSLPIP